MNQPERARDDFIAPSRSTRATCVVLAGLGEAWSRLGRPQESERYFAALLEKDPSDLAARVARGMTRVVRRPAGRGERFPSCPERRRAKRRKPTTEWRSCVRKADPKRALDHLDRSLDSDPNLIDAVQLRALVRARLGERGALDDVDRLVESATPNRLYNAACAVAILSEKTADPRLVSHALDLLTQALKAGIPAQEAAADPDLKSLHATRRWTDLMAGVPR